MTGNYALLTLVASSAASTDAHVGLRHFQSFDAHVHSWAKT